MFTQDKIGQSSPYAFLIAFGHTFFAGMALLSVYFFKERVFYDAAYYLFSLINEKTFVIEHGRFVSVFSQILPYLGLVGGLSLKSLMVLFPLGEIFYFYFLFILIVYVFKAPSVIAFLISVTVAGWYINWYCPVSELMQGTVLFAVLLALFQKETVNSPVNVLLGIALSGIIIFSHPLSFIVVFYFLVWNLLFSNTCTKRTIFILGVASLLFSIVRYFFLDGYESGKINVLLDPEQNNVDQAMATGRVPGYLLLLITEYAWIFLVAAFVAVKLIFTRSWIPLATYVSAIFGFLFLVGFTHFFPTENSQLIERMIYPLVPIVFIPVPALFFKEPTTKVFTYSIPVFVFVTLIFVANILHYSGFHVRRVQYMEQLIRNSGMIGGSKVFLNTKNIDRSKPDLFQWTLPLETLLFSSIDSGVPAVTVCTSEDLTFGKNADSLRTDNYVFTKWNIQPDSCLNPKYFRLLPGKYISLNSAPERANYPDGFFGKIDAIPFCDTIMQVGKSYTIPVLFRNSSGFPLGSLVNNEHQMYISYHWLSTDAQKQEWDGKRTPLEMDVLTSYRQNITIVGPKNPGIYDLSIDLVVENKTWGFLANRKKITVVQ